MFSFLRRGVIEELPSSGIIPEEIFINGDAFYPKGYKVIETEFKALMGV